MPELPEVETVRRRLAPVLEGRRLDRVEISDARLTRPFAPDRIARELEGERVAAVDRRGKYLIVRFESGRALLIHLRMTGSLRTAPSGTARIAADDPHRRAVVRLDDGSDVAYRDVRRFGTWLLLEPGEVAPYSRRAGWARAARAAYRASISAVARTAGQRPVKAAILDQRTLAGVGNIYADEALWRARIHPLRPAGELDPAEVQPPPGHPRQALSGSASAARLDATDYTQPDGERGGDAARVQGLRARRASRATAAARRSRRSASAGAVRGTARPVSPTQRAVRRAGRRGRGARARCSRRSAPVDQDLRHGPAARQVVERRAEAGSSSRFVSSYTIPGCVEQRLRANAVAAPARRVHLDLRHHGFKR